VVDRQPGFGGGVGTRQVFTATWTGLVVRRFVSCHRLRQSFPMHGEDRVINAIKECSKYVSRDRGHGVEGSRTVGSLSGRGWSSFARGETET